MAALSRPQAESIIEAGILAPSADNRHLLRFRISDSGIELWGGPELHSAPFHRRVLASISLGAVLENMALGDMRRYERLGGLGVDWTTARADLSRSLDRCGFSIPSVDTRIGALSGGNVQRAILAREMAREPRLIVALYPTRGLDLRSTVAARLV